MYNNYWFVKYFRIKYHKRCIVCGEYAEDYFCSDKCKNKMLRDKNLKEINRLRAELSKYQNYLYHKPIYSRGENKKKPLVFFDYNDRISNTFYNRTIKKMDKICSKIKANIKTVDKKYSFTIDF